LSWARFVGRAAVGITAWTTNVVVSELKKKVEHSLVFCKVGNSVMGIFTPPKYSNRCFGYPLKKISID
jgi:hypothetical protein